jgi:hypothetical protein
MRLGSFLLDCLELSGKGLNRGVVRIGVLHPVNRVEVAQTTVDVHTLNHVVRRTVSAPGRLIRVGSSRCEYVNVVCQDTFKHRTRLACLNVNHQLVVHTVFVHVVN